MPRASSILDIGCGDGALLRELMALYPGATFVGVDLSLINTARAPPGTTLLCADYCAWQPSQRFELVIAAGVLHLLDIPDGALADKLCDHVVDGGALVYDLPIRSTLNLINAATRRTLRSTRGRYTDAAIKRAGRLVYGRSFDADFIEDRLTYLYTPPHRYDDGFGAELERRGLTFVHADGVPRQSFIEFNATRAVHIRNGRG